MSNNTNAKIVAKISIGSMKLKGAVAIGQNKPVPLAAIYGTVSGSKVVEDKQTGQIHEALVGDFEATILFGDDKGTRFRSGVAYLPKGMHEQMVSAAKKLLDDSDAIEFAIQVNAVTATNAAGYSYEGEILYKPESAPDPMDALRAKLPGIEALTRPALEATTKKK